jgi:hypothetical protein
MSPTRRPWFRLPIGLVLLVQLGCSSDSASNESAPGSRGSFPPGTITPPNEPERDCGEFEEVVSPTVADHHDQLGCLQESFDRNVPAVLVVHGGTTEGDPYRMQYRVLRTSGTEQSGSVDRLEVLTDMTRDKFGSGKVEAQRCTTLRVEAEVIHYDGCHPS